MEYEGGYPEIVMPTLRGFGTLWYWYGLARFGFSAIYGCFIQACGVAKDEIVI